MSVNTISAIERQMYNDEFKMDFERNKSLLKRCVRTDGLMRAGTIYWDVVSPSEEAQVRTRDGDIPEAQEGYSQVSATPVEHYGGKFRKDTFDLFKSNPNVRNVHYKQAGSACYRACDQMIIDELDSVSNELDTGSAITFNTYGNILRWVSALENNDVPSDDGRLWGVVTPTALRQMQRINEFTSADFVEVKKLENGLPSMGYYRWLGVNWFSHTGLSGKGGTTAKCYIFHEDTIGHQDDGEPEFHAYYYEPQNRFETYAVYRHAAKLCLPRGVFRAVHNDSGATWS